MDDTQRMDVDLAPIDLEKYRFVKRAPQRPFGSKHDLFVSSNTQFIAAVKKAQKMLRNDSQTPITIHGLGEAIKKAVDVSNHVCKSYGSTLTISARTSSMPMVDDYEPLFAGLPPISQVRFVSSIHLTLSPLKVDLSKTE